MSLLHELANLFHHQQSQPQPARTFPAPQQVAPQMPAAQQGQAIPLGSTQSVEGFYPQDNTAPMADPTDVANFYQPSYQNPQPSIHMGYQQNQGLNSFGNPGTQQLQPPADPFGWMQNNQPPAIKNFRNPY